GGGNNGNDNPRNSEGRMSAGYTGLDQNNRSKLQERQSANRESNWNTDRNPSREQNIPNRTPELSGNRGSFDQNTPSQSRNWNNNRGGSPRQTFPTQSGGSSMNRSGGFSGGSRMNIPNHSSSSRGSSSMNLPS